MEIGARAYVMGRVQATMFDLSVAFGRHSRGTRRAGHRDVCLISWVVGRNGVYRSIKEVMYLRPWRTRSFGEILNGAHAHFGVEEHKSVMNSWNRNGLYPLLVARTHSQYPIPNADMNTVPGGEVTGSCCSIIFLTAFEDLDDGCHVVFVQWHRSGQTTSWSVVHPLAANK
ncbi:hypothetical protein F441_10765 [Phytophthora nicotianae CJ01A1]|uniref:Uncharacterized protein n=1 Tax=Phytophthora nicotianae CJ01A1 TaxID=1317063 RepID=W2WVD7_PHYNI|nr:hypothetical protein F441_10765 [Phytophthora nicotianae CJ01A1]